MKGYIKSVDISPDVVGVPQHMVNMGSGIVDVTMQIENLKEVQPLLDVFHSMKKARIIIMEEKKAEATLIIPEKKKDQPIADFLNEQLNEAMPGIIDAAARDMVSQIVSSRFIAEAIVQKLNEINELDSSVLPKLINYRVRCNDKFANHPTIQVGQANYPPGYQVGFLGILNGLIGVKTDDWGYVAADMNPDGSIKRFLILEDKQR